MRQSNQAEGPTDWRMRAYLPQNYIPITTASKLGMDCRQARASQRRRERGNAKGTVLELDWNELVHFDQSLHWV